MLPQSLNWAEFWGIGRLKRLGFAWPSWLAGFWATWVRHFELGPKKAGAYIYSVVRKTPPAMNISLPCLNLHQIFCGVDDSHRAFEAACSQTPQLPTLDRAKPYRSRLCLSEVMTIVIAFHGSGLRTFKDF